MEITKVNTTGLVSIAFSAPFIVPETTANLEATFKDENGVERRNFELSIDLVDDY